MFEFNRVTDMQILRLAWASVRSKNSVGGYDKISIEDYAKDEETNLTRLRFSLTSELYEPYREKPMDMDGRRIYLSCVEDKIVQSAIVIVLQEIVEFPANVHGFITGRSVFTAHDELRRAIKRPFPRRLFKTDIDSFYESIDRDLLLEKLQTVSGDYKFIALIRMFLELNDRGISAGSCLSPVLSNIYLLDFDKQIAEHTELYIRYVDDMLISGIDEGGAPSTLEGILIRDFVTEALADNKLAPSLSKTRVISPGETFEYLGTCFVNGGDDIESMISRGEFVQAEALLDSEDNGEESDFPISGNSLSEIHRPLLEDVPAHIGAVAKGCSIISQIISKAESERYLTHQERRALAYSFACLGDEGCSFVHRVLSQAIGYDYGVTRQRLDRARKLHPVGCRKLNERFGYLSDQYVCTCHFDIPDMYPSPICHAIAIDPDSYHAPEGRDSLGHFRNRKTNERLDDIVKRFAELNMKRQEINDQQNICNEQIGMLFERNGVTEVSTSLGMLVKTDDGYFLKLG